jgi:hypothetical protein
MRVIAYILAIICIIVAGSAHIHTKHAAIAVVAAVILAVIGWLVGRRS